MDISTVVICFTSLAALEWSIFFLEHCCRRRSHLSYVFHVPLILLFSYVWMAYWDARYWPAKPVKDWKETLVFFSCIANSYWDATENVPALLFFKCNLFLSIVEGLIFRSLGHPKFFARLIFLLQLQPVLFSPTGHNRNKNWIQQWTRKSYSAHPSPPFVL